MAGEDGVRANGVEEADPSGGAGSVLGPLFHSAFKAAPFDFVYTLLRVGGLESPDWDPFGESLAALDSFDWILTKVHERGDTSARRVGLLMYCHALEIRAVHEILANLLRCRAKAGYSPTPLGHLGRVKGKKSGLNLFTGYVPPSARQRYNYIKRLAATAGYPELNGAIDRFFDDRVRNAFYHSDYVLTGSHFRFREGRAAQQIPVEALDQLIGECFDFYGAFVELHHQWLHALGRQRRFRKGPGLYEVFELLRTEEEGLYGFNVHFSNGSKATFMRRKDTGTEGSYNITFDKDGINFYVGQLETLEEVWKIDGKPVDDWSALP